MAKGKRTIMPKRKDNAVFRHSVVKTKKVNVNPYPYRGGFRM